MTENTPQHQGVVVFNMNDIPLGMKNKSYFFISHF